MLLVILHPLPGRPQGTDLCRLQPHYLLCNLWLIDITLHSCKYSNTTAGASSTQFTYECCQAWGTMNDMAKQLAVGEEKQRAACHMDWFDCNGWMYSTSPLTPVLPLWRLPTGSHTKSMSVLISWRNGVPLLSTTTNWDQLWCVDKVKLPYFNETELNLTALARHPQPNERWHYSLHTEDCLLHLGLYCKWAVAPSQWSHQIHLTLPWEAQCWRENQAAWNAWNKQC